MSLSESELVSLRSEGVRGTLPVMKSPAGGGGLSLFSFCSCLRLKSRVSIKNAAAAAMQIKPHISKYTKINIAAAAHRAESTQQIILKVLNILYIIHTACPKIKRLIGNESNATKFG